MSKKELPLSPPQPGQPQQVTQFYHRSVGEMAASKFEKDCRQMEATGWRLTFATSLGVTTALGGGESLVAIYQK